MVMLTLVFQEKRDGNHWGRRRGECCAEGVGVLQQPGCGGSAWAVPRSWHCPGATLAMARCWVGEVGAPGWREAAHPWADGRWFCPAEKS